VSAAARAPITTDYHREHMKPLAPPTALTTALATVGAAGGLAAVTHALPSVTAVRPVRLALTPGLAGRGQEGHVALTFDDGPDPVSTPRFVDELGRHQVRATFFLLGFMLERHPTLGRDLVAAGHEVAVHGYEHRNLLGRGPAATYRDIAAATGLIEDATGVRPRFYRPPYGILTTSAAVAAARLGLQPVLWTAWGKDWSAQATASSVRRTVARQLADRGTILLHDADCTSAPQSWRSALGALPGLIERCASEGLRVGTLGEHLPLRG
jgi:peptidoglycan-N-acetylglucosamine deacetylase